MIKWAEEMAQGGREQSANGGARTGFRRGGARAFPRGASGNAACTLHLIDDVNIIFRIYIFCQRIFRLELI